MCGIAGIVTCAHDSLHIPGGVLERMRDRIAHRGPDDAAMWRNNHAAIGFRRLAILDPTDAGAQPIVLRSGRLIVAYNGELYNDAELRAQLRREAREPLRFQSSCDAETVARAWERWGLDALDRSRGMFALAVLDLDAKRLTLARDPLGIKPMYLWRGSWRGRPQLAFASELSALLEHPAVSREPDPVAVSAYLTTIRTTVAERTLFRDIRAITPGQVVEFDLGDDRLSETTRRLTLAPPTTGDTAEVLGDSVRRHLRSDRPICAMLSGGLDSALICRLATDAGATLRTYCAGVADCVDPDADFARAQEMASAIGSTHTETRVDAQAFARVWTDTAARLATPLSTPNEVAIRLVARAMRADGCVVALSGEGADELFAGYESPMRAAAAHIEAGNHNPGAFQLDSNAWIARAAKRGVLAPDAFRSAEHDEHLLQHYIATFAECAAGNEPLAAHLRFHRRINLVGLLARLDTSTMLEGVEGRTPIADRVVAAHAESLPIADRFAINADGTSSTKIALRNAARGRLPAAIIRRPKASFPLPFADWMSPVANALSPEITDWITPAAIAMVRANPKACWPLAWPILNLALWLGAVDLNRIDLQEPAAAA